jgi:hypothetical protein
MKYRYMALCALIAVAGCQGSTRAINLGTNELTTLNPIALTEDAMPMAASRDGTRIAVVADAAPGNTRVTVRKVDTQESLGSIDVPNSMQGTMMFNEDGTILYVEADEGYVAWNYATGAKTKIMDTGPKPREFGFLVACGWNGDRSVAILYPQAKGFQSANQKGNPQKEAGQVVAEGVTHDIPPLDLAGFDEYGLAWYGHGNDWTSVDKRGRTSKSTHRPKYLALDQTRDRGSMHLRDTHQEMNYKNAKAMVSCVWLSHDRAVPYSVTDKGKTTRVKATDQACVVFAGCDIVDYGFMPGRDMVYVVSGFGVYLVPFKVAPRLKSVGAKQLGL